MTAILDTLAGACEAVRRAGPGDAVAGVMPSCVAFPATVDEAAALMRAAAAHKLAVVPRGDGTRLGWGAPPDRCDLVVDTTRLDRIIEHAAGDLVVRVQAGVRIERLASVLGEAGQQLALDLPPGLDRSGPGAAYPRTPGLDRSGPGVAYPGTPGLDRSRPGEANLDRHGLDRSRPAGAGSGTPGPDRSRPEQADRREAAPGAPGCGTVGGVLATGVAGPRRLRYGTPRDLVIGITIVRADGTVARSGGKVAKNVAGYDLGKLFAGSYGTLGLIAEAAFRLHPGPVASAYVTLETDDAGASAAVAAALDSPLLPSAIEIDRPNPGGPVQVSVLLEGGDPPSAVAERASRLCDTLGQGAWSGGVAPPWWGRSAAAPADGTLIRIAFWAVALPAVLEAIDAAALSAGLDPAVGGSAGAGVLYAAVDGGAEPGAVGEFAAALRRAIAGTAISPATVRATRGGAPTTPTVLTWGDNPPAPPARDITRGTTTPPHPAPPTRDNPTGLARGGAPRGSVVVVSAPPRTRSAIDLWGPVPGIGLMRAVKDQFDPEHRMAPGRFAGF